MSAVHGVGGAWGTLAAGIFHETELMNVRVVMTQATGIAACFLWTFPTAFLTFKFLEMTFGLRVESRDEQRGLDFTEHYEVSYPEFTESLHAGKD